MPELPEVEITKRGVEAHFLGQTLQRMTVRQPQLRWPIPSSVHGCESHVLLQVQRRSKYLILDFGQSIQVVHLGMSGALKIVEATTPWEKHDHVEWQFERGVLRLNDPRRFGSLTHHLKTPDGALEDWVPTLAKLGPEPLTDDFEPQAFVAALKGRNMAIKQLLLSGQAVVGVGNIYACEALFRAGIRPGRAARRVTRAQALALHGHVRDVLCEAIERGGSSLRNFHAVDGELGHFQLHCDVYGREGQPCNRCATPIKRRVLGQRGTFFCPTCQV